VSYNVIPIAHGLILGGNGRITNPGATHFIEANLQLSLTSASHLGHGYNWRAEFTKIGPIFSQLSIPEKIGSIS
jgi:hypothetical protein